MQEYIEIINKAMEKVGVIISPDLAGEDADLRLRILWEAAVRVTAKLNHIDFGTSPVSFTLSDHYANFTVDKARGGSVNGREYFFVLNPDSVVIPINKSPTMAFFMIKRAAEALAGLYPDWQEKRGEFEDRGGWDFPVYWELAKAFRFKKDVSQVVPHFLRDKNEK